MTEAAVMQPAKRKYTRRADIRSEPVREEVRPEATDGGTVLRPTRTVRTRPGQQDQLHIPDDVLAKFNNEVDFQWVVDSVLGKPEIQGRLAFEMNGWEPVPAEVFDGRFMPKGHKGEINVGGLVLMWRRMELTMQARAEDQRAARQAVGIQEAKLKSGQVDGISLDTQHPTARGVTRLTREILPGIPVPK